MPKFQTALRLLLLLVLVSFSSVRAQTIPTLVADSIRYDAGSNTLIAIGNVQVFYADALLEAQKIEYDQNAGVIRAEGPLRLTTPDGSVMIADLAELSSDLRQGLVFGAKVLLESRFQIAASESHLSREGINTFYGVVGSSCEICASNPVPMWQIRAARVTHDAAARTYHFHNARFEFMGVPVFGSPYLRAFDPGVERATGLLTPEVIISQRFGYGMKFPYFWVFGDHADATLTTFLTTSGATLAEIEYRHRFLSGWYDVNGAVAAFDGEGESGRYFVTAQGEFALPGNFMLSFETIHTADSGFMRSFDYNDADRLTSEVSVVQTGGGTFASIGMVAFQSLRDDEVNSEIPFLLPELFYRKSWSDPSNLGMFGLTIEGTGLYRTETADETGRDMARLSAQLDWQRRWDLPYGIRGTLLSRATGDAYLVWQDSNYAEDLLIRTHPTVGAELRWPFAKSQGGAFQTIEPVAQVLWTFAPDWNADVPNEDSQQVEFDETNLFAINRFPGVDRQETGGRANVGVEYRRVDPAGWELAAALGQVLRTEPSDQFSEGSGLSETRSDILAAVSFELPPNIYAINRVLVDSDFEFKRSEAEVSLHYDRFDFGAAFVYLAPDVIDEEAINARSEANTSFRYQFHPNWEARGEWRYDLIESDSVSALGGLTFGNECIEIDISLSRRFTASTSVEAATQIGIDIELVGFGRETQRQWQAHECLTTR